MFCSNCGNEIDDKAAVCVHCGAPTKNFTSNGKSPVDPNEPPNTGYIVLSVLVPMFGIILGAIEKGNGRQRAGKAYLTAAVSVIAFWVIFSLVITIISVGLPFLILLFSAGSEAASNSH